MATLHISIWNNYWQGYSISIKYRIVRFPPPRQNKKAETCTTAVLGWFSIIVITYMTTWLGDKYEGEHKEGWYHGYGRLEM